jgi:SAM-dependent methyltransferase
MEPKDRENYVNRYRGRLTEFGATPEALGWGKNPRQEVRFGVLGEGALRRPDSSVLDVGCGFADLYDFLRKRGWKGTYTGIDLVPELLTEARRRHEGLDVKESDLAQLGGTAKYDFVVASGIFNAKLLSGDNPGHILSSIEKMVQLARVAVSVDFLTTYVDFQKPDAWHTDPGWILSQSRKFSRCARLRCDYMPFEFALILQKDDTLSPRNVFNTFEAQD